MRNVWFLLLFYCVTVLAAGENIEVYATKIDSNETALHAYGDVVILYQDHYLSANEAVYDRVTGALELFGNITAMQGATFHAIGEYVRFDIMKKERHFSPFYMLDKSSDVWASCKEAYAIDKNFELKSGMMSGCNPNDPIWKIHFSSSDYDSESKWLNIYNARLHIYDIPVFYFPYFGYSLNTTRRSGLLVPSFGFSTSSEGFYYQQPVFIALQDAWDVELRPQIRTLRGEGLYATLRFVDSKVSKGEITTGYFKEKSSYMKNQDDELENRVHYGFNMEYENHAFLRQWFGLALPGQSGAFVDINWMNDVHYITLATNDEIENQTPSQVLSRINFFYNEKNDYVGAYFKYFLDLSQPDNDKTIQNFPTLQYHHYLTTFFEDHLLYNVTFSFNNYYRKTGKIARQSELDIPLTLQGSAFDGYLDFSYRARLYGQYTAFGGIADAIDIDSDYQAGMLVRNSHTFEAGTYLTKGYEGFSHSIALNASYVQAGSEDRSGYYESSRTVCRDDPANEICDYYTISDIEETTQLKFTQFLFDEEGRQLLYHRLSQSVSYDNEDRLGELENELNWQISSAVSLYSDTLFDHQASTVTKQLSTLRYNDAKISLSLDHRFEDKLLRNRSADSSFVTASMAYRYNRHYRYSAKYAYEIETAVKQNVEVGFLYTKRCWDFGLRYVENNRATGPETSTYDKYVYATVMLRPIGGTEFKMFKLKDQLEGS